MSSRILLTAFLASFSVIAHTAPVVLASFQVKDSLKGWISVNDGVMGGVSKGGFKRTEAGTLLFSGRLSLENNGGFASIRTEPRPMDLTGATALLIKARGDGRTYWAELRTAGQMGASSYRADLPTRKGEWIETRIPLADFKLQAFGKSLPGGSINAAKVDSLGFTLADKKAGPFELEIEQIYQVLLPPDAAGKPLAARGLIELAIDRGVPLFNDGNPAACAAVYEITCESLRLLPDVTEDARKDLERALREMRTEPSARQKAWILRNSLDRVFARLPEG